MVLRLPVCLLLLLGVCSGVRLLVTTVSAFVPSSSSAAGSSSATFIAERIKFQQQQYGVGTIHQPHPHDRHRVVTATKATATAATTVTDPEPCFDIDTALFCAGLAFDAYVEPPPDSSRWERGSKGMNVAFVSSKYTRNLYRGMVEITPIEVTDLPDEDDTLESVATGNGVDVCVMCAVLEGQLWSDDVAQLEKDPNHAGIFALNGAAHVGRSRTAWANVNKQKSAASAKAKTRTSAGEGALPYHIPKSFLKSGTAVWPETERPYYLYVQDPEHVQLVFSLFDDDIIGDGSVISSTVVPLKDVLPKVGTDIVATIKQQLVAKYVAAAAAAAASREEEDDAATSSSMALDTTQLNEEVNAAIKKSVDEDYKWEGALKMNIKPKIENKNSQMAAGAAAGAMLAGPVGAAAGAAFGAFYEGAAKGTMKVRIRYLPVPPSSSQTQTDDAKYRVLGGLPGIDWGQLYELNLEEKDDATASTGTMSTTDTTTTVTSNQEPPSSLLGGNDLEFCFFINHDQTGASVGVYRSIEQKRIVVSFRGTCQPVDLITDASIYQVPWIEGEYDEQTLKNIDHDNFAMVHVGFRKSMESISRRLKTLILGTVDVASGHTIEDYEILVTGHSLGGALATLFTADIAEYGIDAGRSLPQKAPSDPWWKGIASTLTGTDSNKRKVPTKNKGPPRPKSLRMYNFGSPRAGNTAFSKQFDKFLKNGWIDEAYRVVNSKDIITRVPRTMIQFDYEHCGRTVLIEEPPPQQQEQSVVDPQKVDDSSSSSSFVDTSDIRYALWVEGESEFERIDPVRDIRGATTNILSEGTLLDDLYQTYKGGEDNANAASATTSEETGAGGMFAQFGAVADRLKQVDVADLTSVLGIDRSYANREIELAQSFAGGKSLANHLEDSYYIAMGRATGFNTTVGEDIARL